MSGRDALSPREVAERTGLSYHAVVRAIDRGELLGRRVCGGSRILIPVAAYREWAGLDDQPPAAEPAPRTRNRVRLPRSDSGAGSFDRLTAIERTG